MNFTESYKGWGTDFRLKKQSLQSDRVLKSQSVQEPGKSVLLCYCTSTSVGKKNGLKDLPVKGKSSTKKKKKIQ